ncbi:MAG: alcohol dehydrogenase catalytic domain-containing protein [Treponema sp.]|nr:alcohol dehydrogenase catalytic domain-containing protein [Treponema sp.]
MLQLLTEKPMSLVMMNEKDPAITQPNEVLVKVMAAGICGSDMHIYHGTSPVATYPRVMGHEIVGVVAETGSGVSRVKTGDHVIVDQIVACGECYACRVKRPNVCSNLKVRGVHIDGGYREYLTVEENALHILPNDLPFTEAVMLEPASIAFQVSSRAEITKDDTVFILGSGALGKSLIRAVLLTGAQIIAADTSQARLKEAAELGVKYCINSKEENLSEKLREYTTWGPSVSIDAAGFAESLALLVDVTCTAGRIITTGFLDAQSEVQQFKITAKELDIRGSRLQNKKIAEVIAACRAGKISFTGAVSHVIPFSEAVQAFQMIDSGKEDVKKAVLAF